MYDHKKRTIIELVSISNWAQTQIKKVQFSRQITLIYEHLLMCGVTKDSISSSESFNLDAYKT